MQLTRSAGILLHPTSLPGPYGIGDLGPQAHGFIDWLSASGCTLWQILPLGPTGYGNSPYQCHSVFAGNPNLISPDLMVRDGLLEAADLETAEDVASRPAVVSTQVHFDRVIPWKQSLLRTAFARFRESASNAQKAEFSGFLTDNAAWLEDFSLFMALKEHYGGVAWTEWPPEIRARRSDVLDPLAETLREATSACSFSQMVFHSQWSELSRHAHESGLQIFGDVPIFAAEDSSDVWAHPELFCLDSGGLPTVIAGVPPDYFAQTGQLWGNPLYRWEFHEQTGFSWWLERLRASLRVADIVRLDHFRGFAAYWAVPAGAPTAEMGKWMPGPAEGLLDAVAERLRADPDSKELPLIAEDLGVMTPDVDRLLRRYALPGMRVLQFGLAGLDETFLPHNYAEHCVAYTGTHDNDTSRGWFENAPFPEKQAALEYLGSQESTIVSDMIRAVWSSVARYALCPIQDLLDLGTQARMNYPGRPEGNWAWRLGPDALTVSLAEKLRDLNSECGRLGSEYRLA